MTQEQYNKAKELINQIDTDKTVMAQICHTYKNVETDNFLKNYSDLISDFVDKVMERYKELEEEFNSQFSQL